MIPKYPDGLPLPLRDGYSVEPVDQIRRTEMDVGRAVQRIEFEDAPAFPTLSWIFTAPEARLFIAWQRQIAKSGWFTMKLVTPMGFDDLKVRFTETPKGGGLVGRYCWQYSARCEIEYEPILADGWAEILPDWILHADIFDIAMNREWPLDE